MRIPLGSSRTSLRLLHARVSDSRRLSRQQRAGLRSLPFRVETITRPRSQSSFHPAFLTRRAKGVPLQELRRPADLSRILARATLFEVTGSMASSDSLYLLTVNEYMAMAAITCSFLEAIATLPDEIALVWPTDWSSMKFLFLANKYMALGDALFEAMGYSRMMHLSNRACSVLFQVYSYWYLTGTIFCEVILLTRTLALWGFHKYLTAFILLAAIQLIPEVYYAVYYWVSFLEFAPRPLVKSCFTGVYSQDAWPPFLLFVGVETFIVGLTLTKRFYCRDFSWSRDSRTLQTLYRDGTAFWFIVLAFSMANFVVMFIAPVELSNCMHPPLRAVHSALCTRVFLNLRKAAAKECPSNPEFTMLTTLAFEHSAEPDAHSLHELEDTDEEAVIHEEIACVRDVRVPLRTASRFS